MTLTIERTTVDFDPEMTREYYKSHTVCNCCDDKNYQGFAKERFPELDSFLSQFGVDISRPDETGSVYLEKNGMIQYLFVAYTVVGRIITEDQNDMILNASDRPIKVSINNEYYPNEQKGDYFSIVVTGIELPWLLGGEYPDKPKNHCFNDSQHISKNNSYVPGAGSPAPIYYGAVSSGAWNEL